VKKWIRLLLEYFGLFPRADLIAHLSPDHPDQATLPPGLLHVVGGKGYQKWAYFKCPCGCGALIMLSLSTERRPNWRVDTDWFDRPTVRPSVWQTDGCFSHFFIKQGHIDWCHDTGTPPNRDFRI